MKPQRYLNRSLLVVISTCAATILCGCSTFKWVIDNPYADVDWKQDRQVKANFHTHTTQSDGSIGPPEAVDKYHILGYEVLALTDHNKVTWPWEAFNRDPERLKMVAVQGSEPSDHHNMGVFFCEVPGGSSEAETLAQVRKKNGVGVMFHPGRYQWPVKDYVALYKEWDELVGMEIFNQGDRYSDDQKTWDKVLTVLMPENRSVWGFSNDDMHDDSHLGRNWNVLLLPELSLDSVRRAMENGHVFFVYAPGGHRGIAPPRIHSIEVDSRKGIIRIKATDYEKIEWISGGDIVHHGEMIDLATKANVRGYVRAVIYAKEGGPLIGTQPLRIHPRGD